MSNPGTSAPTSAQFRPHLCPSQWRKHHHHHAIITSTMSLLGLAKCIKH